MYVSEIVLLEIGRTSDDARREVLFGVLREHAMDVLPFSPRDEIEHLAAAYREYGAIPMAKIEDALHVAHATVHEMDILLSWNFKHLANLRREMRIDSVNREQGYMRPLRVTSPLEVQNDDKS